MENAFLGCGVGLECSSDGAMVATSEGNRTAGPEALIKTNRTIHERWGGQDHGALNKRVLLVGKKSVNRSRYRPTATNMD